MARKKQSAGDDFIGLVAMLPWWGGVVLAIVFYFVLHHFAVVPKIVPVLGQPVTDVIGRTMIAGLAYGGQFLVPLLCLLAAFVSYIGRRKREGLIDDVSGLKGADAINAMTWREFEMLVGEAFRLQGYKVTELGGGGADGGVDLVLKKGTETYLVQCKQWKTFTVGVSVVRELYGVMAARGAAGGFVVTSGRFTADASSFAEGRNLNLIDGPKMIGLIEQAKAALGRGAARLGPVGVTATQSRSSSSVDSVPECPICSSKMVRRTAKKGANAGTQFWGCARYPACRGTR
jgi:restriction system protein